MVGTIRSNKGFYVGDICYALSDEIYDKVWGEKYGYRDGEYEANGYKFAVAGTAYGDGAFMDQCYRVYGVDAGVIGVVPLELVRAEYRNGGNIFEGTTEAIYSFANGRFNILFDNETRVEIDTH